MRQTRWRPIAIAFVMTTLLSGCRCSESPPTSPEEITKAGVVNEIDNTPTGEDEKAVNRPHPFRDSPAIAHLPASTWLLIATSNPMALGKSLGVPEVVLRFPNWFAKTGEGSVGTLEILGASLSNHAYFERLGLDPGAPAGFAIVGSADTQINNVAFATLKRTDAKYQESFINAIRTIFPEAHPEQMGKNTIIRDLDSASQSIRRWTIVLRDQTAFFIDLDGAKSGEALIQAIAQPDHTHGLIAKQDFQTLSQSLGRNHQLAIYIHLAPILEDTAQSIEDSIGKTYQHARDALKRVQSETAEPEVIAHWKNRVKMEKQWLLESQGHLKAEAEFFRSVYGSITSAALGLNIQEKGLLIDGQIHLRDKSILRSLFRTGGTDTKSPLEQEGQSLLLLGGQPHWQTVHTIMEKIVEVSPSPLPGIETIVQTTSPALLDAASKHPFQASLLGEVTPWEMTNEGAIPPGIKVEATWRADDPSVVDDLFAKIGLIPHAQLSTKDQGRAVRVESEGVVCTINEKDGSLRIQLEANGKSSKMENENNASPQMPESRALRLINRPEPALFGWMKTQSLALLIWDTPTSDAGVSPDEHAPPGSTVIAEKPVKGKGNKELLSQIDRKKEEIRQVERERTAKEQAAILSFLKPLGQIALHLRNTEAGWEVHAGWFLSESTVGQQVVQSLEKILQRPPPSALERRHRTLRRELRILERVPQDKRALGEEPIRHLPVIQSE